MSSSSGGSNGTVHWSTFARLLGINEEYHYACKCRLICDEEPESKEGPGLPLIPLCLPKGDPVSKTSEVFEGQCLASDGGFGNQGLADRENREYAARSVSRCSICVVLFILVSCYDRAQRRRSLCFLV